MYPRFHPIGNIQQYVSTYPTHPPISAQRGVDPQKKPHPGRYLEQKQQTYCNILHQICQSEDKRQTNASFCPESFAETLMR